MLNGTQALTPHYLTFPMRLGSALMPRLPQIYTATGVKEEKKKQTRLQSERCLHTVNIMCTYSQRISAADPKNVPRSTNAWTRRGCNWAYATARSEPQDPPTTTPHASTPRCTRTRSMSASRCPVVFRSMQPNGRLRPDPRWSNTMMRNKRGLKKHRAANPLPRPGPPCKNRAGTPSGLPH